MRVPAILFAWYLFVLVLIGCDKKKQGADDQAADTSSQVMEATPVANPEDELALKAAQTLENKYSTGFESALSAAISENGPMGAMEVCRTIAPTLLRNETGGGWVVRRVSQNYRNSDNRADTLQIQILHEFMRNPSRKFEHSWAPMGEQRVYSYYSAIKTTAICLNCHGDANAMDPKVVAYLKDKYPADKAVGYKVGDVQGLFVIQALWPNAKMRAEQIVATAQK